MSTYTYIDTDGEAYNRGRAEGHADVAVELRKLVDPQDKEHLNLTGTLKKVERLLAENEALRRRLDDWEATWYVCHDGSEDACCKNHE